MSQDDWEADVAERAKLREALPEGFTPVPGEEGVWFALGRDIPNHGGWERNDTLPQNHHERRWWRGERGADEHDAVFVVRKSRKMYEMRAVVDLPGSVLASSDILVDHVEVDAERIWSYHAADGTVLGRTPNAQQSVRVYVPVEGNEPVVRDD